MFEQSEYFPYNKLEPQGSYDTSSSFRTSKKKPSGEKQYSDIGGLPQHCESQKIVTPIPSIPRDEFQGKTLIKWGIERRIEAKRLREIWNKALQNIAEPSFAMYVNQLLNEINNLMSRFRNIDYEEIFAGILQLIHDALDGEKLIAFQRKLVPTGMIDFAFQEVATKEELNFEIYKKVQEEFSKYKLLKLK
jgi:hypothetical protein